jgi:hypothetical protein
VTHAINMLVLVILTLAGLVMEFIGFIDGILAAAMTSMGIPPNAQAILLLVAAIVLVVFAIRAFGRIFAALIIVLLVLLVVHKVFPGMQVPRGPTPAWLHAVPGQLHTSI